MPLRLSESSWIIADDIIIHSVIFRSRLDRDTRGYSMFFLRIRKGRSNGKRLLHLCPARVAYSKHAFFIRQLEDYGFSVLEGGSLLSYHYMALFDKTL